MSILMVETDLSLYIKVRIVLPLQTNFMKMEYSLNSLLYHETIEID